MYHLVNELGYLLGGRYVATWRFNGFKIIAIETKAKAISKNRIMWRQMCIQDIPSVRSIARDVWPGYEETPTIYENKFRVSPAGCYVYVVNDSIKGYIISHPWNALSPPPLNRPLVEVEVNCWFIHDIVVLPECRGRGVGHEMIQRILADNPVVSLVACDDETVKTKDFWIRYGFEVAEAIDCNYGIYMIRKS